jgi:pyruvate formate lyase activating enzyme
VFYKNSGGGITLSGGEVTAQSEFALAVLKRCKEAGLHTVLDTCGYARWPVLEELLRYTDLVLYDIKCIGVEKHRQATGRSNRIILENARRIARIKPMRVRVPLVTGFNDSIREVRAIRRFTETELGSSDIDLHAYNRMGETKYEWLDRRCTHLRTIAQRRMEALEAVVSRAAKQ